MNAKFTKHSKADSPVLDRKWTEIHAFLPDGDVWLLPGEAKAIASGLKLTIPNDLVGMLCTHHPSDTWHSEVIPGQLWDCMTTEFNVVVRNNGKERICIKHGDPIARLVMLGYYPIKWKEEV